jgi:hypothetical protein
VGNGERMFDRIDAEQVGNITSAELAADLR